MTYLDFLVRFLVIPILLLMVLRVWERRTRDLSPGDKAGHGEWVAIGILIAAAVIYTTPWDNYLVAHGVWWYNPSLVSGILLGYVPLEEYTFFILQTLLVGLWWRVLTRRILVRNSFVPSPRLRFWSALFLSIVWAFGVALFFSGWKPATYLSITLAWALPPIILQAGFGADILWHQRKLVAACSLPIILFLSLADTLAIKAATWTIDPVQSTGLLIGGLPLEEGVFFFVTVLLVTFGLVLSLATESRVRFLSTTRLRQTHRAR